MKMLTRKEDESDVYILVCLKEDKLRSHICCLVEKGHYSRAISEARDSSEDLKVVPAQIAHRESVSLILTEKSAHWDAAI